MRSFRDSMGKFGTRLASWWKGLVVWLKEPRPAHSRGMHIGMLFSLMLVTITFTTKYDRWWWRQEKEQAHQRYVDISGKYHKVVEDYSTLHGDHKKLVGDYVKVVDDYTKLVDKYKKLIPPQRGSKDELETANPPKRMLLPAVPIRELINNDPKIANRPQPEIKDCLVQEIDLKKGEMLELETPDGRPVFSGVGDGIERKVTLAKDAKLVLLKMEGEPFIVIDLRKSGF